MASQKLNKNIKSKSSFKKLKIFLCCFIVVGFLAFGFTLLNQNKDLKNAIVLATTVKPETFTELYFENHLSLPNEIKPNKPYSFKFTLHNLENQNMTYHYEVYLHAGDIKLPIDQDTISIKNNQYKTIEETFLVNAPVTKSLIVVNLINKNQQIDFWINDSQTQK